MTSANKQSYLIVKIVLFFIGFLYFSNSIGLSNSIDTPQYFTSESIINFRTVDISNYKQHPHFFVAPDIYLNSDQIFSIRGFLFSALNIPTHLLGRIFSFLVSYKFLPTQITYPHFALELSITMLFSLVFLACLMILSACLYFAKIDSKIAAIIILVSGLGTYFWKYAGSITRQPLVALFLVIGQAFLLISPKIKNKKMELAIPIIGGILSGIDPIVFVSVGAFLLIDLLGVIKKNFIFSAIRLGIFLAVAAYISIFHLIFYKSFSYSLYDKYPSFQEIPKEKLSSFLFGTPLLPTINYILFGHTPLPADTLSHFAGYPNTSETFSTQFAMTYDFYGLFFITPLFILSLYGLYLLSKTNNRLFYYTTVIFIINLVLNTKWFGFYAANSYDVRYFYPFMVLLAFPTAIGIQNVFAIKNVLLKILSMVVVLGLTVWSIFMGWLGVINMYKPALTGERRIFVSLSEFIANPKAFSFFDYFQATLPNFYNAIPFTLLFIAAYSFFKLISVRSFVSGRK